MKQSILLTSLCLLLTTNAFATDVPQMPGNPHKNMPMMQMTDEQKSCIASFNCPKMERPAKPENADIKPDAKEKPEMRERPEPREMTDEERTAMECMRKAMESCGIQMPTPPQRPDNSDEQRRESPMGRQKPQRPERPVNQ